MEASRSAKGMLRGQGRRERRGEERRGGRISIGGKRRDQGRQEEIFLRTKRCYVMELHQGMHGDGVS